MKEILSATQCGWRLEIHAIGDAAVAQVLTALESVHTQSASPLTRPVLTHCQVLGEDLIQRMKALGVIANIQPSFVPVSRVSVSACLGHCYDHNADGLI